VLAWLGFHPQSFDRGFYLLVKAIQELRERKDGLVVTVGIGGPTGSGKTRYGPLPSSPPRAGCCC
jgi:pantothenate kinase-related protein Tda10